MDATIIYHKIKRNINCPDGLTAAWIARKVYPEAKIIGWCYEDEDVPTIDSSKLIIVDFSFPSPIIKNWISKKKEIILLDHHISAWEELKKFSSRITYKYDVKECGATLAWKYFFSGKKPPAFLKYIKDRDLWDFLLPETEFVHEAMGHLGRSFMLFDNLEKMEEEVLIGYLKPIAIPLLQDKLDTILAAFKRLEWGTVAGYANIPFIRLRPKEERLISDICLKIYRTYPDASFSACVRANGIHWSLRSDKNGNNTDVAAIVKKYGGGGHRNAGSFLANSPD